MLAVSMVVRPCSRWVIRRRRPRDNCSLESATISRQKITVLRRSVCSGIVRYSLKSIVTDFRFRAFFCSAMPKITQIMIVVGESSGDTHAAHLVYALRDLKSEMTFEFFGTTGPKMREAGVE